MGKEWDPEDLIDAVSSATPPTNKKDADAIEGLFRAICTKIRNKAPIPAKHQNDYGDTWDHVAIELWRNT